MNVKNLRVTEAEATYAGIRTRVLRSEGQGPPTILIHGYADSADCWRPLLELFARERRPAIAFDVIGCGHADQLKSGPVLPQIDEMLDAAIMAEGEKGDPVLVGTSLGGLSALRAGARIPDGIASIAAIAPAGRGPFPWLRALDTASPLIPLLRAPLPIPRLLIARLVETGYRTTNFHDPINACAATTSALGDHLSHKRRLVDTLDAGHRVLMELESGPFESGPVDCPVAVIWGESDRVLPVSGAQAILNAVPQATLDIIPRSGHAAQVETPRAIHRLISKLPRTRRRSVIRRLGGPFSA